MSGLVSSDVQLKSKHTSIWIIDFNFMLSIFFAEKKNFACDKRKERI